MAGLCIVVMMLSALFPSLSYALPMVAGAIILIPSIEFGTQAALATYISAAILSFILPADKESALFFVLLFGIYPIVKKYYEQISYRVLEYAAKFAHFNASAIGAVWLASFFFSIPIDDGSLGKWGIPVLLAVGNFAFIFYDIMLTKLVTLYVYKLQPILRKTFNIK